MMTMRKLLFISILTLLIVACQSNRQGQQINGSGDSLPNVNVAVLPAEGPAAIKFDTVFFDLGALEINGPDETRDFHFTNTGGSPLVIEKVETSCHCLDVVYPKEAIAPGTRSKITMTLKLNEILSGQFYRSANVYTNASEEPTEIILQGIKKYE